ncbi:MAG: hypothetical protein HC846_07185 [Blastocatellia bacterium]|nr:hypothetical protein [Blastocatellia bacterium]
MRAKILILSFVFIFTTIFTNQIIANPIILTEGQKEIVGTWQLKKTVSDSKTKQVKESFIPAVFAPESLVLAAENEVDEITINEGFKEFIQTQTLPTDGKIVTKNIFQIGKVSTKAIWQGKTLVVETLTEKGDKITESFELSANKKQLFVTLQLAQKGSAKTLKVRRIYSRVAEINEGNTAQIGITVYPF